MDNEQIITPSLLKELTGYQRQADIEKWCFANNVRFFRSPKGVWTTLAAMNSALKVNYGEDKQAVSF